MGIPLLQCLGTIDNYSLNAVFDQLAPTLWQFHPKRHETMSKAFFQGRCITSGASIYPLGQLSYQKGK